MRRTLLGGTSLAAVVMLGVTGCGGDDPAPAPSPSPTTPTARKAPPPLDWVSGGYKGNPWLEHVTAADWQGETLVVSTDYTDVKQAGAGAAQACTAFKAYRLFVRRGTAVTVNSTGGEVLTTC